MFRRKFKVQELDHLYVEGLIRQAINELRDMKDVYGNWVHSHHNLTLVRDHLNKYHNIDINMPVLHNYKDTKSIKGSNNGISNIYVRIANNYKRLNRNNYSFTPLENKGTFLLKAVAELLRL